MRYRDQPTIEVTQRVHCDVATAWKYVTDINLPGDVDGSGLAEQARAVNPRLPVLFASGRWWRLEELQKLPNAATLRKPYSPARACEAVELLLAEQTSIAGDGEQEREAALVL